MLFWCIFFDQAELTMSYYDLTMMEILFEKSFYYKITVELILVNVVWESLIFICTSTHQPFYTHCIVKIDFNKKLI